MSLYAEGASQRIEACAIGSGARRVASQGLPDLGGAGGANAARGFVETQAGLVEGQAAIGQQSADTGFRIVQQGFVAMQVDAPWVAIPEAVHGVFAGAQVPADVIEVAGEMRQAVELLPEAGPGGLQRVATGIAS